MSDFWIEWHIGLLMWMNLSLKPIRAQSSFSTMIITNHIFFGWLGCCWFAIYHDWREKNTQLKSHFSRGGRKLYSIEEMIINKVIGLP